jgi:hypothetical protein
MTGLLALFTALARRRDDLVGEVGPGHRRSLGGCDLPLIDAGLSMLGSALPVACLRYTTEDAVMTRLGTTHL